jgi:NAD+ synthase
VRPLANLTVTEVIAVGKELRLPDWAIYKVPADGLCGETDEQKMGISYSKLDTYIRTGKIDDLEMKKRIDDRHNANLFKQEPIPSFSPTCLKREM